MRYSNLFFFSFLVLILFSFSFIPIGTADQIVLDEDGYPLIMDGTSIILKNDKSGTITWEEFKQNYTLAKIDGMWRILEGAPKATPLKEYKESEEFKELFPLAQREKIEKEVKEFEAKQKEKIGNAGQIVLDEDGYPLVMDGTPIILKNGKTGTITWEEFKQNYTLAKIDGKWRILEGAPKAMSLEEYKESEEFKELFPLAQREKIEKEVEEFKAFKLDKDLSPISSDEMNKYIEKMLSPLILFLFGGIAILVLITYASNIYAGSLGMVIYLVIGVIMEIVPIWVLVLISLVGAGLVAYALSSGISGGGGE